MAKRERSSAAASAALQIRDLHVYYGQSHALQGVNLSLERGVHAVLGRNGMGKTTLCNTVTGLIQPARGSIRLYGEDITGLAPYKISARGVGYTPQGRRLWSSLTVDEHLRLCASRGAVWTTERVYETFPRLYERRRNGGAQLSGGEQQMLAIARALLRDPRLLVLDEPTEGLAPVIVDQVEHLLAQLAAESDVAILLIEQNTAVATAIAEDVAVMVNGRINRVLPAAQLAADRTLQEQLLGVGRHSHEEAELPALAEASPGPAGHDNDTETPVPPEVPSAPAPARTSLVYVPPTRWSSAAWSKGKPPEAPMSTPVVETAVERPFDAKPEPTYKEPPPRGPARTGERRRVYLVGTFDTKGTELRYLRECMVQSALSVRTVDLSTSGKPSSADVPPHVVAAYHRGGGGTIFSDDRGTAVRAMAAAFENWIQHQHDIGGIISAGGSGGTALATPAMRRLPVGLPKVMISTVASGDVGQYVGPTDIMMVYSVTDVQGLNRISKRILANGASALAGMVKAAHSATVDEGDSSNLPGLGLTMFGVTTPAVQQITARLEDRYDCLVFHATGTGGQSMEKLVDSGLLAAAIDLTTTEVCDMMMGGVFPATEDRFGAFIRTRIPYVGSVGALDMVNFGARDTVPDGFKDRLFVEHNPQVTLMRTTPEENVRTGEWIAGRLNQMAGPVRFLLPEGGVSMLDAPGQPFHDPAADRALFEAIAARFQQTGSRRLIRTPHHINDPAFAAEVIAALEEIDPIKRTSTYASF